VRAEVASAVAAAALTADDPAQAVYTGLSAFLDACLKPEFRQIVVLDSVPVLQRQAWEDGSTGHSELDMPSQVLTPLAAPYLPGLDMESLAHVALGGLYGAALNIARSPEPNRPGRGGRRPGHPHHRTPIVAGAGQGTLPVAPHGQHAGYLARLIARCFLHDGIRRVDMPQVASAVGGCRRSPGTKLWCGGNVCTMGVCPGLTVTRWAASPWL
jgi:hypothetical protein